MSDTACEVVRRYNEAWLTFDIDGMKPFVGDDLVLWHNHLDRIFNRDEMFGFVVGSLDTLTNVEFRDARRTETATGCIQQHVLCCELSTGAVISAPQVIVYTVRDGLIRKIEEYVDGAALAVPGIQR